MFKNTFQSGFLSILYSIGSKPLQLWDKAVANGHISRITDEDIQSSVLELTSANVATTYITCPADPAATLGVKLPFLVMVVRDIKLGKLISKFKINCTMSNSSLRHLDAVVSMQRLPSALPVAALAVGEESEKVLQL
jgi:hypothetical protein